MESNAFEPSRPGAERFVIMIPPPNVTGALHMGVSANTRYQIVNGIERVLYGILPQGAARGASVATRLANNLLGARLWIVMTKITGLA